MPNSKPPYKWIYRKPLRWVRQPKAWRQFSMRRLILCFSVVVLFGMVIFSVLSQLTRSNLSSVQLVSEQPQFVGIATVQTSRSGTRPVLHIIDANGYRYTINQQHFPLPLPKTGLYAKANQIQPDGKHLHNLQTESYPQFKITHITSLVWAKINNQTDLNALKQELLMTSFNTADGLSHAQSAYPIKISYIQNGKTHHYQRPLSDYQHLINAACKTCVSTPIVWRATTTVQ